MTVWEFADVLRTNRIPSPREAPVASGGSIPWQETVNAALDCGPHRP